MNRNATPGRLSASQSTAGPTSAMRSSQPLRSGKVVSGASGGRAESSGTKSPKRALEDDRDEYVTNLKGQIYLLTIENEMLKQTKGESAPEGEMQSSVYASGAARAAEREKDAERAADAVAAAAMPDELADLEAHMRTKYAQVEAKYQQDLADARRAAEALSTQCAAQSSLIAALKQEISSSNDVIAQQKHLMSSTEASLGAELRRARDDIAELSAHVSALQAEGENASNVIKAREISISDLRSRLAEAQAARQAAEHARTKVLDSYARNYTALQVVLKRWREERIQALAARSALEVMRASRDAAEGRAESAESDASIARTAQNEAFVARDDALYAARQLRSRLEVVELALQRTQADAEYRARAIDELEEGVTASIKRAETAEAATTGAVVEKEAAQKRAGALEREITRVAAETDSVRVTLTTVGQKHAEADSRARELAELLALAQSKLEASEHSLEQDASRISSLERSNAIERDNRIAAEAEVTRLRDELSRRPPLDVLRSLDIDSLMQRNLQAAAAMQSLLQFVNPHARSSTASGLFSSTGDA